MNKGQEKMLSQCEEEVKKMGTTKHPRTKRYSGKLKQHIVAFIKSGGKMAIVSSRLDIPSGTIDRWLKDNHDVNPFKEVQVASDYKPSKYGSLTLQTPSGYKIQFEHLQDLVSVLKLVT